MKDAIRYTVTITATVERMETVGKRWERVGPADAAEYGYTPMTENLVRSEDEIFMQTVDTLDLPAVIRAVNGLAP